MIECDDTNWPLAIVLAEEAMTLADHQHFLKSWSAWLDRASPFVLLRIFTTSRATAEPEGALTQTWAWGSKPMPKEFAPMCSRSARPFRAISLDRAPETGAYRAIVWRPDARFHGWPHRGLLASRRDARAGRPEPRQPVVAARDQALGGPQPRRNRSSQAARNSVATAARRLPPPPPFGRSPLPHYAALHGGGWAAPILPREAGEGDHAKRGGRGRAPPGVARFAFPRRSRACYSQFD